MTARTLQLNTTNVPDFLRYAIGVRSGATTASQAAQAANQGNYPPHNIEKLTDNHYVLVLAVAGFAKEEISVTLHKGILKVRGEKVVENSMTRAVVTDIQVPGGELHETMKKIDEVEAEYIYQGIAFRPFEREFTLGETVKVKNAALRDGLLVISLERDTPIEERPVPIEID